MKTDSIFYRIFKAIPGILFELLGHPPDLAQNYQFESVEVELCLFVVYGIDGEKAYPAE